MASVEEIDKLNILNASLLAMKRALLALNKRPKQCFIDGLYAPKIEGIGMMTVVKGDSLIPSISAASIIAKVERDRHMESYMSYIHNMSFIHTRDTLQRNISL